MLIFHEYGVPDDLDGVAVSGIVRISIRQVYIRRCMKRAS